MIDVSQIVARQRHLVELWHAHPIENSYCDLMYLVCEQHRFNFLLWHEEDKARDVGATDTQIAAVKRAIDRYNQQRNDATEQIDDYLKSWLESQEISPPADAPLNTETPGSAIDRLSILALRLYHMREQTERADATAEHAARAQQKLAIMHQQQRDSVGGARRSVGRPPLRPQTPGPLPPIQNVQRSDAESVSLQEISVGSRKLANAAALLCVAIDRPLKIAA